MAAVLPKGRSSTANSGIKIAVLLGMNRYPDLAEVVVKKKRTVYLGDSASYPPQEPKIMGDSTGYPPSRVDEWD